MSSSSASNYVMPVRPRDAVIMLEEFGRRKAASPAAAMRKVAANCSGVGAIAGPRVAMSGDAAHLRACATGFARELGAGSRAR